MKYIKTHLDGIVGGAVIICLFITGVLTLAHPLRLVSEKENRELASYPETNIQTILDGTFMCQFETYAAEQFILRDSAVSLKADVMRLMARPENNGVYFSKNGYLISRPDEFDKDNTDNNIGAIKIFKESGDYDVTVAAIPTAYEVLKDKLPPFSYTDTVLQIEDEIKHQFSETDINVCDVTDMLSEHKNEYIYYRTDHHQTALGSYYVYAALGEYLGYEPKPIEDFTSHTLSNRFYGTTWSKASIDFARADSVDKYTLNGFAMSYTVEYPLEGSKMLGLYAMRNLDTKDKYSVYLGGNHGLTVIRNAAGKTGRSLAVLKDSYAHSIAPFLATEFDTIYLIDLRYYNDDIILYLAQNKVTDVLALYNAETFNTDKSLGGLGELAKTTAYVPQPPYGLVQEQPPVTEDYFADAVFFGDSLTLGHSAYSALPAKFIAKSATNTRIVHSETMSSGKTMMNELLTSDGINKYYIMFGINEVSYTPLETYIERYRNMITEIKAANPDALIYIESIMPVAKSQEQRKIYKSKILDANAALCSLAQETECYYLDIYSAIAQPDGYLRDDAAKDGVHFSKSEHDIWDAYLMKHAVSIGGTVQASKFTLYTGGGSADIDGFVSDILSSIQFEDSLSEAADNVTARIFHLDSDSLVAGKLYIGSGSTAEEFAIFEANSPSAAAELGEKLKARIDEKKPNFETYKPEEMPKLNNAVIVVNNNLAMLCISDDPEKAKEIMSRY